MHYRSDCIHFRGDRPCRPHKLEGVHCDGCPRFVARAGRILLIKLGAAGDVVRTTPLLEPLQRHFPQHVLTWVTHYPELVPAVVPDVARLDVATTLWVSNTDWDLVINLDKDREACALARQAPAQRRCGFTLHEDGLCHPVDDAAARAKYLTGLFDDVNRANALSYLQEIFAICGYKFAGQEYMVDRPDPPARFALPPGRAVVGLNSGCGPRWPSRLWPEAHWAELARALRAAGYAVVLLGGPDEHERNTKLAAATGASYPGHFDLRTFIGLLDRCDLVVTAVTMAMHLALGLRKKLVLLNNIFNPSEFELYGRGVIVEPPQPCTCFFQPRCSAAKFCLESLAPATVAAAVRSLLETQ